MEGDTVDYVGYFDELLAEMRQLNRIKHFNGEKFRHAGSLLSAEISHVWSRLSGEQPRRFLLETKIPIPQLKDSRGRKCNLIGRILGPCGISVKQLEASTRCEILIRGNGSVKDQEKEQRLRGLPGWEHLNEPLHVVIRAADEYEQRAKVKMAAGCQIIRELLIPKYDEHKKKQLILHAVINGTYRQIYRRGGGEGTARK